MNNPAFTLTEDPGVEALFGDELASADKALATIDPMLRHLLGNADHALFSDRVLAQVRAQIEDLAWQLANSVKAASGESEIRERAGETAALIAAALIDNPVILRHAHALALEVQLAERLSTRLSFDPVLSPLLQALIASPEPDIAATAIQVLAAQARFVQTQRRGELPLSELPGDVLHAALLTMRAICAGETPTRQRIVTALEAAIRSNFDEAASRFGLLHRLLGVMDGGAQAALDVAYSGVALFISALGLGAGLERDAAMLATSQAQLPRLALTLLAIGLRPAVVEQQCAALHPEATLPDGFEALSGERAGGLLAVSRGFAN